MMRNPVFDSSMRRRMRSFRAPLLITLYMLFILVVGMTAILTLQSDEVSISGLRIGLETYAYIIVMQFFLIVLVSPALTAGSIAGERERQTLDLLLCTRVGAMKIVLGKLFSSVCFIALLLVTALPITAVTLYFGGVTLGQILLMTLYLIVTALACSAIGVFCSALFKRTVTATVMAYLIIFALGAGTLVIPVLFQSQQLVALQDVIYSYTNNNSSSVAVIGAGNAAFSTALDAFRNTPKLLFLNPAVGVFSLLVEQTGMLERTFQEILGYRGSQFYTFLEFSGSIAVVNIVLLLLCSALLVVAAALLVKPSGRRAKKR